MSPLAPASLMAFRLLPRKPLVGRHRRRDGIHREPGRLPDDLARLQVVASQLVHARDDDVRPPVVFDDERRRPGVDLVARGAPEFLPRPLVERHDERRALDEVIPDHDERVAVQGRRRAFAELVPHRLVAEVLLPDQRAVHVVAVEAARLERGDDVFAVGDRRTRRPRAVVLMRGFVRRFFLGRTFPRDRPVLAVDRQQLVGVHQPRRHRAARLMRLAEGYPARHRGQEEEAIAPDDRAGRPAARDFNLPLDVFRLAPLDGRVG
jgi:hypothetical protein